MASLTVVNLQILILKSQAFDLFRIVAQLILVGVSSYCQIFPIFADNYKFSLNIDPFSCLAYCFQCFDTVGWVAGRASGL